MKALDDYLKLQKEIYDYFGYVEDWVVIPIDDCREYLWYIEDESAVRYARAEDGFKTGECYRDEIYKQRFLPKWIYETDKYTMICVDTKTDGNKFLAIYDNSKKIEEGIFL